MIDTISISKIFDQQALTKPIDNFQNRSSDFYIYHQNLNRKPHHNVIKFETTSTENNDIYNKLCLGYVPAPLVFQSFTGATLNKKLGIVITKENKIIDETLSAERWLDPTLSHAKKLLSKDLSSAIAIQGLSLFATHGNYCVYSHFICEMACSIFAMRNQIIDMGIKVILPRIDIAYIEKILDALEIPRNQRMYLSDLYNYKFETLIVSSACSARPTYNPNQVLIDFSKYLQKHFNVKKSLQPSKRLFLSRTNAKIITGSRVLINELKLSNQLRELGFISIDPSSMPLEDQIKIFSEAEIIIGPHGSAFINMIFMSPGGLVIDIIPDHWLKPGLQFTSSLSNLANLKYGFFHATSTQIGGRFESTANIDIIKKTLKQYLGPSES